MSRSTVDPFDLLSPEAANTAVRAVEDAIDDHLEHNGSRGYYACSCRVPDGEQGPAVVRALLDLGWRPPA